MSTRHPPLAPTPPDDSIAGLRADLARVTALSEASANAMVDGVLNTPEDAERRIPHTRLWRTRTALRDELRQMITDAERRA